MDWSRRHRLALALDHGVMDDPVLVAGLLTEQRVRSLSTGGNGGQASSRLEQA